MDRSQWPTPADVQSWLTLANAWGGITDDLSDVIQDIIDATVTGFSDDTGWCPFLSAGSDSTNYFDAPGPRQPNGHTGGGNKLFLGAGLLALTSLTIDGRTLTEGTDFELQDYNSLPFTKVLFLRQRVYTKPKGIAITGRWGYCTTIPSNVWDAVRNKASATMLEPLASMRRVIAEAAQTAQITAKQTGPVRTEYAKQDATKTTDFSALGAAWCAEYDSVATKYLMV